MECKCVGIQPVVCVLDTSQCLRGSLIVHFSRHTGEMFKMSVSWIVDVYEGGSHYLPTHCRYAHIVHCCVRMCVFVHVCVYMHVGNTFVTNKNAERSSVCCSSLCAHVMS